MCSPGNRFRLCWRFLSHSEGPGESTDTGSKMGTGIKRTIRRLCIEIPRPTLTVDVILINALFLPHHTLNTLVHPTGMLTHTLSHHLQLPLSAARFSRLFTPTDWAQTNLVPQSDVYYHLSFSPTVRSNTGHIFTRLRSILCLHPWPVSRSSLNWSHSQTDPHVQQTPPEKHSHHI